MNIFPLPNYAGLTARLGKPGNAKCTMGRVFVRHHMVLAWDVSKKVDFFRCHIDVEKPMQQLFDLIEGELDLETIHKLGLNFFGGCFNDRFMRGSQTKKSVHAWGAAIDIDPARNALHMKAPEARLSRPDAEVFINIVQSVGMRSSGVDRGFDWMHFQFCNFA